MTERQIQIIDAYYAGKLSRSACFLAFGGEIEDVNFVKRVIEEAIESGKEESIRRAMNLMWLQKDHEKFIDELNILLLNPNHRSHQVITKKIQDLKSPKSIPFIKKELQSNFDYLEYTCSDSGVIAKWFSWALFSIGTKEAIELIEAYTKSEDEGVRNEMLYRHNKVKNKNDQWKHGTISGY